MEADKGDENHYRVGDLVITRERIFGPDINYVLSAFSRLRVTPRPGDIDMLSVFILGLAIIIADYLFNAPDEHGIIRSHEPFADALLGVVFISNCVTRVSYLGRYGRLVGELKSGSSVVLSRNMTRADGVKALSAFSRFTSFSSGGAS
jgi:hypothetical protein